MATALNDTRSKLLKILSEMINNTSTKYVFIGTAKAGFGVLDTPFAI